MYLCTKGGLNTVITFGYYKASIFAGGNFHRVTRRHSRADPNTVSSLTGQENWPQSHSCQLKAAFPGGSQVKGYVPVWQPVTQIGISSRKTNPEANEKEETGNVLKNAPRREEEDTKEPNLSLSPAVEVFKLAGTGSQVIQAGAQAALLQSRQMLR